MSCHEEIRQWANAMNCLIITLTKICFDIFPLKRDKVSKRLKLSTNSTIKFSPIRKLLFL